MPKRLRPEAIQERQVLAGPVVNSDILQTFLADCQQNNAATVSALLAHGLDPRTANDLGQTGLHVACLWGNFECAELFVATMVSKGMRLDLKNGFGDTALHLCACDKFRGAQENQKKCVELLVKNGANVSVKDGRGRTPYQRSTRNDIQDLLVCGGPVLQAGLSGQGGVGAASSGQVLGAGSCKLESLSDSDADSGLDSEGERSEGRAEVEGSNSESGQDGRGDEGSALVPGDADADE